MSRAPPWTPSAADAALARALGPGAAFLPLEDGYAHVTAPRAAGRSPVLDLCQAIWELRPATAHLALRRRIRLADPVRQDDRDIADVAAKRVAHVPPGDGDPPPSRDLSAFAAAARERARAASFDPGCATVPRDVAGWLASLVPAGDDRPWRLRDRPVVAVLSGPDGRILAAARNASGGHRTLHAEVCLVQSHGTIPSGSTIWTSLQPCRMCAAVLVGAAAGPLRARHLLPDPGRLATRTALQQRGWEQVVEAERERG